MQSDPWWEAVEQLEARLLGLLAEMRDQIGDDWADAGHGSWPFLGDVPGGYTVSDSKLLDYAVPVDDAWPDASMAW
jgi:hypothetical protein